MQHSHLYGGNTPGIEQHGLEYYHFNPYITPSMTIVVLNHLLLAHYITVIGNAICV